MIADIIILSIVVLFMIIGFKRGIAKTLLNLAGLVITAISAYYLSTFLSQLIYDTFFKQNIISNLEQIIEQEGIEYAILNCFDAVPQWITVLVSFIVGVFGISIDEFEKNMTFSKDLSLTLAQNIEQTLGSVIVTVFGIILIIVIFILLFILVKKIIMLTLKVFNIPVIKQVNKILGGVLGAVEGIVLVWFAINVFYAIMSFTNPDVIENSAITGNLFRYFCMVL